MPDLVRIDLAQPVRRAVSDQPVVGACGTNVNDPCDSVNNATVDGAFAFYWTSVQPILAP